MLRSVLILLLLVAGTVLAGDVYRWVDDQGRTIYSDAPPPGKGATRLAPPLQPSKQMQEQAQPARQEQRRREQPQEVLGSVAFLLVPTPTAIQPYPPVSVTLLLESLTDRSQHRLKAAEPAAVWSVQPDGTVFESEQGFSGSLRPGRYELTGLEVDGASFSDGPIRLGAGGTQFVVPAGQCVYVGRLSYIYHRLSAAPLAEAQAMVARFSREVGRPMTFMYLAKGSLILAAMVVDVPGEAAAPIISISGRQAFERARDQKCQIQLATSGG